MFANRSPCLARWSPQRWPLARSMPAPRAACLAVAASVRDQKLKGVASRLLGAARRRSSPAQPDSHTERVLRLAPGDRSSRAEWRRLARASPPTPTRAAATAFTTMPRSVHRRTRLRIDSPPTVPELRGVSPRRRRETVTSSPPWAEQGFNARRRAERLHRPPSSFPPLSPPPRPSAYLSTSPHCSLAFRSSLNASATSTRSPRNSGGAARSDGTHRPDNCRRHRGRTPCPPSWRNSRSCSATSSTARRMRAGTTR